MSEKGLTLKEQDQLINDLLMFEAVVIAQQQYLMSIGKFEEAKKYVKDYLKDLQKKSEKEVKDGVQK